MTAALLAETPPGAPVADVPARPMGAARLAVLGAGLVIGLPVTVELSRALTTIVLSLLLGH